MVRQMNHLHPDTRHVAGLPAEERLGHFGDDRWIGYTRALDALARMGQLLATQAGRIRPRNMLVVGPSNNGKSTIAEKFMRQHPRRTAVEGDRQIFSVLSVQMPSDATVGRFHALLLDSLGAPVGQTRAVDRRGALARKLMRTCEVRMLLVDELHNLLCGPVSRQRELLGLLRYLGNDLRIPIVALGTRDAYLALRLDDQLENRFQPFLLPHWRDDAETGRLLASFESVLPLREPSGLGLHELRSLIVSRTDGLIGEIHQLLAAASVHALSIGRERITADDIVSCSFEAPAYRRQIMERELRS
ncbi:MAG: AAA family ATPase [Boseongicola sp. SB0676_bin_33]|nr:AAA family ATPase [Boseongicola sp. SB0676_bin_33]